MAPSLSSLYVGGKRRLIQREIILVINQFGRISIIVFMSSISDFCPLLFNSQAVFTGTQMPSARNLALSFLSISKVPLLHPNRTQLKHSIIEHFFWAIVFENQPYIYKALGFVPKQNTFSDGLRKRLFYSNTWYPDSFWYLSSQVKHDRIFFQHWQCIYIEAMHCIFSKPQIHKGEWACITHYHDPWNMSRYYIVQEIAKKWRASTQRFVDLRHRG